MTICNITGTILDSGLEPLEGILRVEIDSAIEGDTGQSIERYERIFEIENGIININLQESETEKVSYHFQFFRLIPNDDVEADPEYEISAKPDFHAIVPNLPTYSWNFLRTQTGITTAAMSSSALIVAREMLTNPNLSPILFNSLGLYKTALPPLNPIDGNNWITPQNEFFTYNELNNEWYSAPKTLTISLSDVDNDTGIINSIPFIPNYAGMIIDLTVVSSVQGNPVNSSNFWSYNTGYIPPDTVSKVTLASNNTITNDENVRHIQEFSNNLRLFWSQINRIYLDVDKTGTPGDLLSIDITIIYRYIVEAQ